MLKAATKVIDLDANGGLIGAIEAGDYDRAMAILIDQHGEHVYRYCRRMLGSGADSDDLSQTVFVQVFQGLKALPRIDSIRSWLIAIARNRCLDRLKAVRRSPEIVPDGLHELVDEHDGAAALFEVGGELAAGGGFAGALQAAHHDDGRAGLDEIDIRVHRPHQVDQLVINDLDHHLAGLEALDDLLPLGLFQHALGEILDDLEIDVGFEQGRAHIAHGIADILFRYAAASGKTAEDAA